MRLEVTRKTDLAIRALCALDCRGKLKASKLASIIDTTPGFVPQVLSPLVHAGWVASEPGPAGGYHLRVPLDEISFLDVIETVEGPTDTGECVLRGGPCGDEPCALHDAWIPARQALTHHLANTPLLRSCSAEAECRHQEVA